MAVLTVQNLFGPAGRAGIDLSTAVAVDTTLHNDRWPNTGAEYVYITNGSGLTVTATEVYQQNNSADGQSTPNRAVTIAAGHSIVLGPFPSTYYTDSSGNCIINWTNDAGTVKILVFRVSPNN